MDGDACSMAVAREQEYRAPKPRQSARSTPGLRRGTDDHLAWPSAWARWVCERHAWPLVRRAADSPLVGCAIRHTRRALPWGVAHPRRERLTGQRLTRAARAQLAAVARP